MGKRTAEVIDAANDQYLDIVDWILTRKRNDPFTAYDYIEWEGRNRDLDWKVDDVPASAGRDGLAVRVQDRMDQMGVATTLTARHVQTPTRTRLWWRILTGEKGVMYRTGNAKSGQYVFDSEAHYRRRGNHIELVGNRWAHCPNYRVRNFLIPRVDPAGAPPPPKPRKLVDVLRDDAPSVSEQGTLGVSLDATDAPERPATPGVPLDPTPDALRAAAEAAAAPAERPAPGAVRYRTVGINPVPDGQAVLSYELPDGSSGVIVARVEAVIPGGAR